MKLPPRTPRWLRWEFMPFWLFYVPVYVYLFVRAIRHRKLTWFLAANPGLRFGGFVEYSKDEMLRHFPEDVLPATRRFAAPPAAAAVLAAMGELGISFPVILKPDIGERGYGVAKIAGEAELTAYLDAWRDGAALLLQEFVSFRREYGVMTVRLPGEVGIRVTSVVIKESLEVVGDGASTLAVLIDNDERAWLHRKMLRRLYADRLEWVPVAGERTVLSDIGNHVRGSTFRDGNRLISDALVRRFSPLMDAIPGFFLGRFDVKADSFAELEAGRFKIMEVNGVNSEPAHIYDPDKGIFSAWTDLLRHWKYINLVSAANMAAGARPESAGELMSALREHYRRRRHSD
jgi:hypothetical protein